MKIFALVVVLLAAAGAASLYMMGSQTALAVNPAPAAIGASTPVSVQVTNPHGVRSLTAYLEQNGARYVVFEETAPAKRFLWARNVPARTVKFDIGKSKAPQLGEGKARLVVEAVSNDFRARQDAAGYDVTVVLTPPHATPDGAQHYINQGGMELVTMSTSGNWNEAGVKVGTYSFRSFALPGRPPSERFAMFAYPWDLPPEVVTRVFVRNAAGTEATAQFWLKVFPKKFRVRDFVIDDALMEKLVNSVDPTGTLAPGKDLLSRFLYINGELRRKNNQQLADLRFKTEEKVLWNGPFLHWGKEEADFADTRNYVYHGQKVDQQTHLGFDLSDVRDGPIAAANDGRVVWASDLGIYGNCIVVDHGYGLQSIYGHLRQINVKVGDTVKKGQSMGIAGETGLAGGVHLHFGMQIDGVQINPREWWDEHWIKDRILSKLQP